MKTLKQEIQNYLTISGCKAFTITDLNTPDILGCCGGNFVAVNIAPVHSLLKTANLVRIEQQGGGIIETSSFADFLTKFANLQKKAVNMKKVETGNPKIEVL